MTGVGAPNEPSPLTPEFESLLEFLCDHPDTSRWDRDIPFAGTRQITRIGAERTGDLTEFLAEGEGRPVVVTGALDGSPDTRALTIPRLLELCGRNRVVANDRAPARHADAGEGGGGRQRTLSLPLDTFVAEYVSAAPATLEGHLSPGASQPRQPFYVNGWRPSTVSATLTRATRPPPCLLAVDDTREIAVALDQALFRGSGGGEDTPWWDAIDASLTKLFVGPPGTITRLHYDSGDAHGWLAQIQGRKVFVLYPPSDTEHLCQLEGERETAQSPVDPLRPDLARWPSCAAAHPLAAVVGEGEAIVVPRGWWHYAVALDASVTLQRNFYNASTNAKGLVELVIRTVNGAVQARKAVGEGERRPVAGVRPGVLASAGSAT